MEAPMDSGQDSDRQDAEGGENLDDDGQDRVDRSKIDFDPDDGLYSGTAVEGTSEIPGPHERGDDVGETDDTESGDDAESDRDEAADEAADGDS
jgi:hypothetical protein